MSLGHDLRAGRPEALAAFRAALEAGGSLRDAARALDLSTRTAESWAQAGHPHAIPAVVLMVRRHRLLALTLAAPDPEGEAAWLTGAVRRLARGSGRRGKSTKKCHG